MAPSDIQPLHRQALLHIEENNWDEALLYLQEAHQRDSTSPLITLHLANVYKAKKDYVSAEKYLLELCQAHPDYAGAYNNLGTIYYAMDRLEDAATYFQLAINAQPDYIDAYYNIALALIKLDQASQAIAALETILELSPDHAASLFQLGRLLMVQGNDASAIDYFKRLDQLHPHHFETQANLAACYLRHGLLDYAETHYAKAHALHPHDVDILFNLGVIAAQKNNWQQAIGYYQQAINIDNDYYAAHNNISVAYLALNKRELALQHFQDVLRLLPQDEAVKHTIDILKQEKNITTSPPAYIKALFDSYAAHYDAHLIKTLNYSVPSLIYNAFLRHCHGNDVHTILDLGCGTGLCAEMFKQDVSFKITSMTGVDLSQKMLDLAAQKKIYDHLRCMDIVEYVAQDNNHYDLVIAGDVFVYHGSLAVIFAGVAKLLKKNGLFIFTTETTDLPDYQLGLTGRFAHHPSYIKQLAEETGFAVLACDQVTLRRDGDENVAGCCYALECLS